MKNGTTPAVSDTISLLWLSEYFATMILMACQSWRDGGLLEDRMRDEQDDGQRGVR